MILVLDIETSVQFWRQRYPVDRKPRPPQPVSLEECAIRKQDIFARTPDWVDDELLAPSSGVLHALTLDNPLSKRLPTLHVHSWTGPVPEGSFYEIQPGVLVESPAFMFLQAASILEFAQLIAFGDGLCGFYSFDRRARRGFRTRTEPVLDKTKLEHFLRQASGCRGHDRAMKALPFVVEQSASPMETFDEMTMCLPYRYGGYSLPAMAMNCEVTLTLEAARIAKRGKCYLDMGYPLQHLDIEHHGKYDHSSPDDVSSDRARVNGLKEMGFEVVELTSDQVGDLFAYELIVKRIARHVGKRLWNPKLGATPERLALRRNLFAWNKSFGRIRGDA